MPSRRTPEKRRKKALVCLANLDLFDRLCAVHFAIRTIRRLGIPRSSELDLVWVRKFAAEFGVRRTLGPEERFQAFVKNCNNTLLPRLQKAKGWKDGAEIVEDFAQNSYIEVEKVKRAPRSAVSKIAHFYRPTICPMYDGYALKALGLLPGSKMPDFAEAFEGVFDVYCKELLSIINSYQEKGGEIPPGLLSSSDLLARRLLDTMLMKAAGREI